MDGPGFYGSKSSCLYPPTTYIPIPRSGLPSALASLFTAHRVYQTMSQGTGHLRSEDIAEPREPYVV